MKTAFQTGPGFFAIQGSKGNSKIPPDSVRVYCVRLEAYDVHESEANGDLAFQILFAQAEGNSEIAKAILNLGEVIKSNRKMLEFEAKRES